MKSWGLLIILCSCSISGFWENQTGTVQAPRISVPEAGGRETPYARIEANSPVMFDIRSKTSVKWVLTCDFPGTVAISRSLDHRDTIISSKPIVKGQNTITLFCEPGVHVLVSSVAVRLRYFVWRNLDLAPIAPVGGGFPVAIQNKDNSRTDYYYVSSDTVALMRIAGPATAYVYTRAFIPVAKNQAAVELEIKKDQQVVSQRLIQAVPSAEAAYVKPEVGYVPAKAALVKFTVPKGVHEYAVRTINDRALVRFYSKPEIPIAPARSKTPVLGSKKPVPATAVAMAEPARTIEPELVSEGPAVYQDVPSRVSRPVSVPSVHTLSITARTGLLYCNNAFTYGGEKYSGFPPDSQFAYRYPGVNSLADVMIPFDMWARWRYKSLQLRGSLGATTYTGNTGLNNLDYSLGMGWIGPGMIEWSYTHIPGKSVRPTYSGTPGLYTMLSYTAHRAEMRMKIESRWHPVMTFSYGTYQYNDPFQYLNALLFGIDVGMARNKIFGVLKTNMIGWNASLGLGEVLAVKETQKDRSNFYMQVKAGSRLDIQSWSLALQGRVRPRFYKTESDSDSNKGRRDLEYFVSPSIQYSTGMVTASLSVFETSGRKVWAADVGDETSKSYINTGGGLQFTVNLRPFDWMPTIKG